MGKKYNIGNKNDMKKFMKNVEKKVYSSAESGVKNSTHTIECPKCKTSKKISFKNGVGKCPTCRSSIDLDINWV